MNESDSITNTIIGAAIRVHRRYGPGLLESAYTTTLGHELVAQGLNVDLALPVALDCGSVRIQRAYVLDLLIDNRVIVEVKCTASIEAIHVAQLLTYLRLMKLQVGLLLNFNVLRMKDGIKRVVNEYEGPEAGRDTPPATPRP